MMKKNTFLIAIAIASATLLAAPAPVLAQSDDEILPPIVFLLLDTSGSMNMLYDEGTNNTRLTNALAEIIGGSTNKDASNKLIRADCGTSYKKKEDFCAAGANGEAFSMPFPKLMTSTGRYKETQKAIPANSKIARPADTSKYTTVDNSYDQNGIIQDYQKLVKFGFAGLAVGSGGSVGKDSAIQRALAVAGGRQANTSLRFTMMWGDNYNDTESTSDLDSHLHFYEFQNGSYSYVGEISYMQSSYKGAKLDVDNTNPKNRDYGTHTICLKRLVDASGNELQADAGTIDSCSSDAMKKESNSATKEIDPETGKYKYKVKHIGVENVYWAMPMKDGKPDLKADRFPNLKDLTKLEFVAQPYRMDNSPTKGYKLELSIADKYGCPVTYSYTFNKDIPSGSHSNRHEYGYPAIELIYHKANPSLGIEEHFDIRPTPDQTGVSYCSDDRFSKNSGSNWGCFTSGTDFTFEQNASAGEPLNIYGMNTITASSDVTGDSITYGKKINDDYKKYPRDCTYDMGIWDMTIDAAAPLVYPTASDDETDIVNNNRRLINAVRTYTATAATPLGEALADIYHMFGGSNTTDINAPDQGLTRYFDTNGNVLTDTKFNCESRKKSVILISDGIPNGSGLLGDTIGSSDAQSHGYSVAIWRDAEALSKRDINIYIIGYSEIFKSIDFSFVTKNGSKYSVDQTTMLNPDTDEITMQKYGAYILSKAAWKGNSCLDENNQIIPPDDSHEQDFLKFLYEYGKSHNRLCFYNAVDKNSLRIAIVSALSQSTGGTTSKTPVVTTTAVGYNTSRATIDGKVQYSNGFYNVYSGYKTYLGNKRDSFLERSVFICKQDSAASSGYAFQIDDNNKTTNIARRHDCKILSCELEYNADNYTKICKEYQDKGEACPDKIDQSTGLKENEIKNSACANRKDGTNTCLNSRIIFSGNYSEARNAIYPDNAKLQDGKQDEFNDGARKYNVNIGFIKDGGGAGKDFHFLTESDPVQCQTNLSLNLNYVTEENKDSLYMVSPYECYSALDCNYGVNDSNTKYLCLRGRCVASNATIPEPASKVCNTHAECKTDEVCHGECDTNGVCETKHCIAGIVKSCDIRSYIASQRLGTIEYAAPTVVEPPNRAYKNADYKIFQQKYWNRDTMLLVGANDGMLHNFILGDSSKADGYVNASGTYAIDESLIPAGGFRDGLEFKEGDELWGFIPKAIMPKIRNLASTGQTTNVNAAPTIADVQATKNYYESDSFKDTYTVPASAGDKQIPVKWRTIAVGGFRDGARGYYALDITNPAKPRVLWEIDPTWKAVSTSSEMDKSMNVSDDDTVSINDFKDNLANINNPNKYYPFMQLGKTYAQPLVTSLVIKNSEGVPELTPVAILSGGLSSNQTKVSDTSTVDNYIGRVMYIVRLFPETPEDLVVKTFYFKNEITGAPAIYPNNFGLPAQHVYFGDNTGALFRLDVKSQDPSNWGSQEKLTIDGVTSASYEKPIFDPQEFEKQTKTKFFEQITHKPAVALFEMSGNRPIIQIAVGTGSNDNLNVNEGADNYVAVFYDVPDGTSGKYTLNESSHPGMLMAFNSELQSNLTITVPKSETSPEQTINLLVNDPADKTTPFKRRQKMTGAPIIYNYDVYFPTYIGTQTTGNGDEICSVGNAAIYAVRNKAKYGTLKSSVQNQNKDTTGNKELNDFITGASSILELKQGTKIYGLQITNQLYCGNGKNGSFAVPQLIAQTGADPGISAVDSKDPNSLIGQSTLSTFTLNLQGIQAHSERVKWASVYE